MILNFKMRFEVVPQPIRVRDMLIDRVCHLLQISNYPCYGDTHEYSEIFWTSLKLALKAVGGKVLEQA